MAAEPTFVDTNILVYANTTTAPLYSRAREALMGLAEGGVELWISRQILREYLATLSRPQPFSSPVAVAELIADLNRFQGQFRIAEDGPAVTMNLMSLVAAFPTGGKQVHDANIVATMQAHGLRRILTHNTADFDRFSPIIRIEPLV